MRYGRDMHAGPHPLVRGAAAAAILTALGSLDRPPDAPSSAPIAEVKGVDGLPAPCPPGTLPEGPVCVRIPITTADTALAPGEAEVARLSLEAEPAPSATPRELAGLDPIPRRPERPADPAAYLYPVGRGRPPRLLGGFDADRALPFRGRTEEQAGVHLAARAGEKVEALSLDHQEGPAEVVFVGDLFGPTVVTRHVVEEAGRPREYLLFHGRLDRAEHGVAAGAKVEAGAALGYARSDTGGGLIEVYLEARQVREGVKVDGSDPKRLTDAAATVPIDLRNVLPKKEP
jgi:hypothetical protein